MPPSGLPIHPRLRVNLTFDLLTPTVYCFMPLPCEPLELICITNGLFVYWCRYYLHAIFIILSSVNPLMGTLCTLKPQSNSDWYTDR